MLTSKEIAAIRWAAMLQAKALAIASKTVVKAVFPC